MAGMTSRLRHVWAASALSILAGCATVPPPPAPQTVQILALNDFHGNLQPTAGVNYNMADGSARSGPLGGAARLGSTLAGLRAGQANSVTVAAGDLIGGSPLISAYYLDEPAIAALNQVGLEIAAVGNHEFDKGVTELKRIQQGGCNGGALVGLRKPCGLDPFEGARFSYLAANVVDEAGKTMFPGSTLRRFGPVTVGFIGMTLKETKTLVSPGGTRGYAFLDEAETANAEAARLRAAGADAIVVLFHQGLDTVPRWNEGAACPQMSGAILPFLERLDPAIRLVVSGHTHNAYVCQVPASDGSPRLLTSAGQYGFFVTDIRLTVDPAGDRVTGLTAVNRPVLDSAGEQADVAALVARYAAAVEPEARKIVGRLSGPVDLATLGYIIADAQLAAARPPEKGGAQFALMNRGGVRTPFTPAADGSVTYGQIFALQPFGNTVSVVELTGAQIIAAIEDVLGQASDLDARRRGLLIPSANAAYTVDWSRPPGQRIVGFTVDGQPLDPRRTYRVALNNFLASGGDKFAGFADARPVGDGGGDLDALQAYLAQGVAAPQGSRVTDVTPSR